MLSQRIIGAQELLVAHPDWSVKMVAYKAGYANHSNFSAYFREAMGKTPTQFRKDQGADFVSCAQRLLVEHRDWAIADVAASLGYANARGFRRCFIKETGTSPAQYRCEQGVGTITVDSVSEVKRFLASTELSLAEIAPRVGYKNSESLRVRFHSATGMSPIEYRRRTCIGNMISSVVAAKDQMEAALESAVA